MEDKERKTSIGLRVKGQGHSDIFWPNFIETDNPKTVQHKENTNRFWGQKVICQGHAVMFHPYLAVTLNP